MRRVWLIAAACVLITGSVEAQWRASAFIGRAATRPADLTVTSPGGDTAVTLFDVPIQSAADVSVAGSMKRLRAPCV